MNKAHLVVSQNFVFQNRASRSTRAHLHTFCRRCQRVPVVVPDGIVCHANKKRRRRRKKRSCCRPQHVVLPIKGFHRNPPQWVEGMPVFVSVLDRYPCPINLLRRRCANWTIPSGRGVFHPTGHATGEPCAARTWQPMAKRLPFLMMFFPLALNPTALGKKSNPRSACVAG